MRVAATVATASLAVLAIATGSWLATATSDDDQSAATMWAADRATASPEPSSSPMGTCAAAEIRNDTAPYVQTQAIDLAISIYHRFPLSFGGYVLRDYLSPDCEYVYFGTTVTTLEAIEVTAAEMGFDVATELVDYSSDFLEEQADALLAGDYPMFGAGALASVDVPTNRVIVYPSVERVNGHVPGWATIDSDGPPPAPSPE